jgi:signal transduction histidine kinase
VGDDHEEISEGWCELGSGARRAQPCRQVAAGWLLLAAMLCFAPLAAAAAPAQQPESTEPWRVVILRSWDAQYPINLERERALREALLRDAPRLVEIYYEDIDPLRFFTAKIEHEFAAFLRDKYGDRRIDVVVASGAEPLEFATRYRDELWPGAAIVFNGVVDGTLDAARLPPRTTGVTVVFDVPGTVALARSLVPSARVVYLVAGEGPFDRFYLAYVERELDRLQLPLAQRRIVDLTYPQFIDRLEHLPPDGFVIYLSMLRDRRGQVAVPGGDNIGRLVRRSSLPVFTAVDTHFGRGPVGGSSAPIAEHGRAAGRLVRAILEGADPEKLPVRADPRPACEVDWRALERWRLSESAVPPECRILNAPVPMWKAYFAPLAFLLSIILLQSALIWALVVQRRQRRIAEAQARARGAEIAQVARLSTIGALTASIAHEINQPMGSILSNTDAAEMMLEQGTLDTAKLREILTDIRSEDLRASEVIRGLRKMLAKREPEATALDVNTEVAEALRHLAFEAARRQVRLVPVFEGDVPAILGDSVQLQQVLINLVMNAMEAMESTAQGEREVRVETRTADGGVQISVADRGPGIPPDQARRLFESMFTTKQEGMGFGLSIVKTIVEMHGGRVSHQPNAPHGAVFRVWLPAIGTGRAP